MMLDLIERDMDGMIRHFNETMCDMKFPRKHKIVLGAIVVAMGYKYQKDMKRIEDDFRKYIDEQVYKTSGVYACNICKNRDKERSGAWGCYCVRKECDGVKE